MDILLWIALFGVIVFLLGLLYSKFSGSAAKQPAAKTISPAIAPAPAPVSAAPPTTQAKVVEVKNSSTAVAEMKSVPAVKPEVAVKPAIAKPAPVKNLSPDNKNIPAAEPVGPAHSKPNQTSVTKLNVKPAEKPAASPAPAAEKPIAAIEPNRLKKPRHDKADDLSQITGIGKAIQSKLFSAGIFHYDQLLDLNAEQTGWIDNVIGFAGRYERENWGAQAKKLAVKSNPTHVETVKRTPKAAVKTPAAKAKTATKPKAKTVKKAVVPN